MGSILGLKIMELKYPATQQQQWPHQLIDQQIKEANNLLWVDCYSFCYHWGTNDQECSKYSYYSYKQSQYDTYILRFNQSALHLVKCSLFQIKVGFFFGSAKLERFFPPKQESSVSLCSLKTLFASIWIPNKPTLHANQLYAQCL